jgi:hypothetical protein
VQQPRFLWAVYILTFRKMNFTELDYLLNNTDNRMPPLSPVTPPALLGQPPLNTPNPRVIYGAPLQEIAIPVNPPFVEQPLTYQQNQQTDYQYPQQPQLSITFGQGQKRPHSYQVD